MTVSWILSPELAWLLRNNRVCAAFALLVPKCRFAALIRAADTFQYQWHTVGPAGLVGKGVPE